MQHPKFTLRKESFFPLNAGEVAGICGGCGQGFIKIHEDLFHSQFPSTCPHMFHLNCGKNPEIHCQLCKTPAFWSRTRVSHERFHISLQTSNKVWGFKLFQYFAAYFSVPLFTIGCPDEWMGYLDKSWTYTHEQVRRALAVFFASVADLKNANIPLSFAFLFKVNCNEIKHEIDTLFLSSEHLEVFSIFKWAIQYYKKQETKDRKLLEQAWRDIMNVLFNIGSLYHLEKIPTLLMLEARMSISRVHQISGDL